MDKAADLILGKMRHEEFNEAAYYEFESDVTIRVSTTYGKLNRASGRDFELLWGIANRMTVRPDIMCIPCPTIAFSALGGDRNC
ncbi:unnamed protein product [Cylicostephanus goldi]|uniref:Uncharacterized protein n=1 Tax=Cylicostephanus goldi TaxID=71465 RepID=A0A3P7M7B6_CYLGO|nr:unnamed protein product [Cylicostephanus goldi]